MKKKSQMQLGESTAVLIIIIILIFVGIMIYRGIANSSQGQRQEEISSAKAAELSAIVFALPELHCTFSGTSSSSCFDLLKVQYVASKKNSASWINYYYDYFGYAKIDINQVYPTMENYTLYENNKSSRQSSTPYIIPVNIYNASAQTYGFGYLSIIKYS